MRSRSDQEVKLSWAHTLLHTAIKLRVTDSVITPFFVNIFEKVFSGITD